MEQRLKAAANEVFNQLGPNWSESIYHKALIRELSERGIPTTTEGTIPVMYKGAPVGRRRPDLFITPENGDTVIVELKAGSSSGESQLMEYLSMTEADANIGPIAGGALIKFNNEVEFDWVEVDNDTSENMGSE